MTADEIVQLALLIQSESEINAAKLVSKLQREAYMDGFEAAQNIAAKTFLAVQSRINYDS